MSTTLQNNKTEPGICNDPLPISGFQEVTLIDWEGKIASIIFIWGCNLRCGFCHSKGLVLDNDNKAMAPIGEIIQSINQKKGWIDGIVITGGEPTLYEAGLFSVLQQIKDNGFLVKLDTNGTRPETVKRVINKKLVDYIAMDIKAPLDQVAYTGAVCADIDINNIKESIDIIMSSGLDYEFRTTAVPGVISLGQIGEIARSIKNAKRYRIQQFQAKDTLQQSFLDLKPYPLKELTEMVEKAREYIPDTSLRGN
jgi:pyruvate formate lyase activating enzyme